LETGKRLAVCQGEGRGLGGLWFLSEGCYALVGDGPKRLLWDIAEGQVVRSWRGDVPWERFDASSNGNYLTVFRDRSFRGPGQGRQDGSVEIHDVLTGRLVHSVITNAPPLALSDDAEWLLVSRERRVELWNLKQGRAWATWEAHARGVNWARFSADGKLLATLGGDDTLRLWPLASLRQGVDRFLHESPQD
jgi:WD40 repeat protein